MVDLTDFEEAMEERDPSIAKLIKKPIQVTRDQFENCWTDFFKSCETTIITLFGFPRSELSINRVRLELVGGGSRVPAVGKFLGDLLNVPVGRSMDGSAFAALGAALWAAGKRDWTSGDSMLDEPNKSRTNKLVKLQSKIESAHSQEIVRLARKNALESYLFDLNRLIDEKSFAKYATTKVKETLSSAWTWFDHKMDNEADDIGQSDGSDFEQKLNEIKSLVEREAKEYFAIQSRERERQEASLTANATTASAGASAQSKREQYQDATASKDQVLKLAQKNKDEGNELFKHGTPLDAMNRYMRALTLLAGKKSEFTSAEQAQANVIALACNLNIAQCVIRLTGSSAKLTPEELTGLLKRGVACADSALAIDPRNSKASYRKAVCLTRMKEPEQAKKVVDEALAEDPADDDLRKLYDSLVQTLQEQKNKAKKFFSKMFQ
jgi:tetratricopeptide (TPR) repeat protein